MRLKITEKRGDGRSLPPYCQRPFGVLALRFFANESGNLMRLCAQTAANLIGVVVFTARSFTGSAREWKLHRVPSGLGPDAHAPAATLEVPVQQAGHRSIPG